LTILRVAVISGADNGSLFMPFGVLTFSRPFAILSFYRKQLRCIKFYMDGEKASENKEFRKMYIMTAVCLVIMLVPSILAGFVR
jgi:hypothetical protein